MSGLILKRGVFKYGWVHNSEIGCGNKQVLGVLDRVSKGTWTGRQNHSEDLIKYLLPEEFL
jgi:hypothetical protein